MMKRMKQISALLLVLLMMTALCGCGGSMAPAGGAMDYPAAEAAYSMPMEASMAMDGSWTENGWAEEAKWTEEDTGSSGAVSGPPRNVKMIYTADIYMESTDFDAAAAGLETLVAEQGGWFEHSQLNNSNRNYRRASYTVRIPAERFNAFCERVGDLCQINSINRDQEDVSERYYDLESRLGTQRTKLERLQALLAQAENMEDIIVLESAISETELSIEQLTGSLRHYDSLVDYSTIYISLSEVYQLTEPEQPAIGFGAKLAAAFRSGTRSFVEGMQDLTLDFARGWAGWLIFIAIVVVAVLLIVRGIKRGRERRAGGPARTPEPRKERKRLLAKKNGETPPTPGNQSGDIEDKTE